MMKRIAVGLLLISTLGLSPKAFAGPVSLTSFQAGGILLSPGTGLTGDSISGQLAWTPRINLPLLGLRGELGATLLKDSLGSSFIATNYEAFLVLGILPVLGLEVGGGLLSLRGAIANTDWVFSVNATVSLIGPIDYLYFGYSRLFHGSDSNKYQLGIGFSL